MKQILVESIKNYNHGFVLKEQDLRRIIDLTVEQMKKLSAEKIEFVYGIKFRNGAIARTSDIEDVLKQENEGSSSLTRLQINAIQINNNEKSRIKIDFRNLIENEDIGGAAIVHSIRSQSRDWVFVTSSLIEERISKIKRRSLDSFFPKAGTRFILGIFIPFFLFIFSFGMLSNLDKKIRDGNVIYQKGVNQIEADWDKKVITDPVTVLFKIEKIRISQNARITTVVDWYGVFLSKPFYIFLTSIVILIIYVSVAGRIYPIYNFCWGNYLDIFSKRESFRKVLFGVILGTVILGIVVNLLSTYIWNNL